MALSFFLLPALGYGQIDQDDWIFSSSVQNEANIKSLSSLPARYMTFQLDPTVFQRKLKSTKQELVLPNPKGEMETYVIIPTEVVDESVVSQYTIKTFKGYKKNDPSVLLACDISSEGFHAAVYEREHTFFIEPLVVGAPKKVMVHYIKHGTGKTKVCKMLDRVKRTQSKSDVKSAYRGPTQKRRFRLAVSAAGEYSQQFGGSSYSATNVLNAIASGVNMINPIFLRDLGVDFILVSGSNLVFRNVNTPYNGLDIDEAQFQIDSKLGDSNYDIGHLVMWAETGGVAEFAVTCEEGSKALGGSGTSQSVTTLWVDYVAHEIGHQMGSEHNFAAGSCGTSVTGFRFEPGEGSSIMAYANICEDSDRYASGSDPFFHYTSIKQIEAALNGTSCGVTSGGNASDPIADAKSNITIPKETPFILVGSATDANDPATQLSYNWEQNDGAGGETQGAPNCNNAKQPLFRFRPPSNAKFRNFPIYTDILSGNNNGAPWEKLPCSARTIAFSLFVRDNNTSFGRTDVDLLKVTVADTGPFAVATPNGGETITGGVGSTVTWSVNGTDAHCANVDILLSVDGGSTYSVVADAVANDGSQSIIMPNSATTTARVLVRCDVAGGFRAASTFFDVSDANFTIQAGASSAQKDLAADDSCIELFPKPTPGHFKIDGSLSNYDIRVLDVNEQVVQDYSGQGNSIDIDYAALPASYFFVSVSHKTNPNLCFQTIIKE